MSKIELGDYAHSDSIFAIAVGGSNASGSHSVAIGGGSFITGTWYGANTNGASAIAIGYQSLASGDYAIAIGGGKNTSTDRGARVIGAGSIGLGYSCNISAAGAVAIGQSATVSANSDNSVVIGNGATIMDASATDCICIGPSALISRSVPLSPTINAISIGSNSNAKTTNCIAIGVNTVSRGTSAIVIGSNTEITAAYLTKNCICIGTSNIISGDLTNCAIGIGALVNVTGKYTIAIGYKSTAQYSSCISLGYNSLSSETQSIAIGTAAQSLADNSIAFGTNAFVLGDSTIVIGNDSAINSNGNDPAYITHNGGHVVIGWNALVKAQPAAATYTSILASCIAIGKNATTYNNVALYSNDTKTYSMMAIGYNSFAGKNYAIAIGSGSSISSTGARATGVSSISIGYYSAASDSDSIAIGRYARSSYTSSIAIGTNTISDGEQSLAIGNNAQATAYRACQIGAGINNVPNSLKFLDNYIFPQISETIYITGAINEKDAVILDYTSGTYIQAPADYTRGNRFAGVASITAASSGSQQVFRNNTITMVADGNINAGAYVKYGAVAGRIASNADILSTANIGMATETKTDGQDIIIILFIVG